MKVPTRPIVWYHYWLYRSNEALLRCACSYMLCSIQDCWVSHVLRTKSASCTRKNKVQRLCLSKAIRASVTPLPLDPTLEPLNDENLVYAGSIRHGGEVCPYFPVFCFLALGFFSSSSSAISSSSFSFRSSPPSTSLSALPEPDDS